MFCSSSWLRTKVPYYTLFRHNHVLNAVFSAPPRKEALVFENPGFDPLHFTFGDLQNDVIGLADTIVARRETLSKNAREPRFSWTQQPRPADVRSVFGAGEGPVSCDVLADNGTYNTAILATPGYSYVVALLASWAVNQMAIPLSVSQKYNDELMYVLEHSKCTQILGEGAELKKRFPEGYNSLYVDSQVAANSVAPAGVTNFTAGHSIQENTYHVNSVLDAKALVAEMHKSRDGSKSALLEAEHLGPLETKRPIRGADDVLNRLDAEKAAHAQRERDCEVNKMESEYKAASAVINDDTEAPSFDDSKLDTINPLFRLWFREPTSRPTLNDDCLMIYTSGTTARPKGAVHTHKSMGNMVRVLQDAWAWTSEDRIIELLPLHHVHGLVNVLLCSLASHATCVVTPFNNATRIAHRIEKGDISLVMAVPTIYTKLIGSINNEMSPIEKTGFRKAVTQRVRLMVSGSAALPVPTLEQFRELSGHTLLERYGMTEIGMGLSQPLRPVSKRLPGTVGSPLPSVDIFVHSGASEGEQSAAASDAKKDAYAEVGQLAIASDSLFDRYWGNPTATKKELVVSQNGHRYFETGDTVGVLPRSSPSDAPVIAILGRSSVDILKSRGYKLSALEIEAGLLSRKDLFQEIAVVGIPDDTLGDAVVAVIAPQPAAAKDWGVPEKCEKYETEELNKKLSKVAHELLAHYKCPMRYVIVPEIPRNPTGKVNKKSLVKQLGLIPNKTA